MFGNQITAADVFLYPQVYNSIARYNLDISGWPNIQRIFGKLSQIKEIQDAAPEKQKDFEWTRNDPIKPIDSSYQPFKELIQ